MPTVWPYPSRSSIIEVLEWRTSVLPTRASEQRICRRAVPRRSWAMSHVVRDAEVSTMRKAVRSTADGWLLPDWPRLVRADAATGAPVALPDGAALVWQSATEYEEVTVTGGVLGTVTTPVLSARIVPLMAARMQEGVEIARRPGGWHEFSASFDVSEGIDEGAATYYPQYQSRDVVTDCPTIGSGTAGESIGWSFETADNGVSTPVDTRVSEWAGAGYLMRWWARDFTDLRAWICSRRGRWKSFWLPSWADDLGVVSRTTQYLYVRRYDPVEPRVAVMIGGVMHYREVAQAVVILGVYRLAFDTVLPDGDVQKAMYLRHVRFASDRIEFEYRASGGCAVAVPCVEVPE